MPAGRGRPSARESAVARSNVRPESGFQVGWLPVDGGLAALTAGQRAHTVAAMLLRFPVGTDVRRLWIPFVTLLVVLLAAAPAARADEWIDHGADGFEPDAVTVDAGE